MKLIFDSEEFIQLEREEKVKLLNIEKQKYDGTDLSKDLESLKTEKLEVESKISENKEKLLSFCYNENNDARLNEINAEIEEIKSQAGVFRQKSSDLDKHKNALEIKNAIAKKDSLTKEIQELKIELENLREQKIESQNSLVEIRSNFENFYNSYNEEMARLMFEEKNIQSIASDSNFNEDVKYDKFRLESVLSEKNLEIIKIKEEIENKRIKCEAVEADILEKQEELASVKIPETSKELIVQAKDLESEIIIYDEMLSRVGKLMDDVKEDLNEAKANYSSQLAAERKIDEDLNKIQESTAKVFENSELTNFEKLRNCDKSLADIRVVEYELGLVDKEIEKLKNKSNTRLVNAEKIKGQILSTEEVLNQKRQVLKDLNNELKSQQDSREEMLGANSLGLLTTYTKVGDYCPICKARVHEKNHVEVIDLVGIDKEIEMTRNKISYAEKDKDMALSAVIALKAKLDFEIEQIEFEKSELQNLENSKTKIYQRVVDINDKTPENFANLKGALKKTSVALENLINLQGKLKTQIDENLTKKIEFGTKISLLTDNQEQLIDLYYVLQKERAERELVMLDAKFAVSGTNFDEKRTEFADNEQNYNRLLGEIIELQEQLNELKTSIFVSMEKLIELEYERGKLETNSNAESININNEYTSCMSLDEINSKKENLKETYKHLLSLKESAELSLQNLLRDYEVKTELLKFKADEMHDVSALVSSLIFRYGFAGEDEVKQFIITDSMLKLKESEVKTYNNRIAKLELLKEYLSESNDCSDDEYMKIQKDNESLKIRLGELNILINQKAEEIEMLSKIESLIKNYSM